MKSKILKDLEIIKKRMIAMEPEEYLTVKGCCERYKWSRTKFNEMKAEGLFNVYKIKGKLLVKVSELDDFINSMKLAVPPAA